jgi:YbgC/YbaW family acyl-CoA thioester hydrolase
MMRRADAVTLLSRLHAAQAEFYAGGGAAALHDVLTRDIAWHVPGNNAIAGDYHGIDAVLDYFRRRRDHAGGTFRMHPRDVLTGEGDRITAITDGSAVIDGTEHEWTTVGLYQVRDGRIAACWLLPLAPEAFDSIWAPRGKAAQAPMSIALLRVRPRHCDAQQMMHASRYYEYFEDAFLEWLDRHVGGYGRLRSDGVDLVVVASGCEHRHGARLDDVLEIETRPTAIGRTSLTMSFTVRHDDEVLAVGRTTYVTVYEGTAVEIPEPLRVILGREG